MRILHFTGEFPPFILGGLGIYVYEVTKCLVSQGHQVSVVFIKGQNRAYQKWTIPTLSNIHLHTIDIPPSLISEMEDGLFDEKTLKKRLPVNDLLNLKFDLLHVHDWYGILWAGVLKRFTGIPTVMTSHLPLRSGFTYSSHPVPMKVKMRLEALGFRICDYIIAPSKTVSEVLSNEYNVWRRKIRVIPNGVDTSFFRPAAKPVSEKLILSVSRLTEQKGIEYLLEAAFQIKQQIKNIQFLIVGDGPLCKDLEHRVHELNLCDFVRFIGFVQRDELLDLYHNSKIFVSTSVYEPFGLTTLEAMSCGVPIVAFSVGGIKEMVRDGIDGYLVAPGDVRSLALRIGELLVNNSSLSRFSANARQRSLSYDWRKIATSLERLYHELLEGT